MVCNMENKASQGKILSVIVPIYNVKPYLRKCVESLLSQDIDRNDYEIILVNDGATDGSETIARSYAERYENIKIVEQSNIGLGGARNTGIKEACGKYVMFVDSDDFLEPNVFERLIDVAEKDGLDLLRFNYQNVDENGNVVAKYKNPKRFANYSGIPCDGKEFLETRLGVACYAWQFLLDKSLLSNTDDYFQPGIHFEDTEWTPRILCKAKRAASTDLVVYNYLQRAGSITNADTPGKRLKNYKDTLFVIGSLKRQEDKHQGINWYGRMIGFMTLSLLGKIYIEDDKIKKSVIGDLHKMNVFPISLGDARFIVKVKQLLINISPMLYVNLLKAKKHVKK